MTLTPVQIIVLVFTALPLLALLVGYLTSNPTVGGCIIGMVTGVALGSGVASLVGLDGFFAIVPILSLALSIGWLTASVGWYIEFGDWELLYFE